MTSDITNISKLTEIVLSNTVDQYYFNHCDNTDNTILRYGIIININNIDYFITTYIPNHNNTISISDLKFISSYSNYFYGLTAYAINHYDENIFKFLKTDFQYKINNYDDFYIIIGENKEEHIAISYDKIKYVYDNNINIMNKLQLTIELSYDKEQNNLAKIYPGNPIINSELKLIGIIESLSMIDINSYVVNIIPSYIIMNWLKGRMKSTVYNLWININEDNIIKNTYLQYTNLNINDHIISVNKKQIYKNNLVKDAKLGFEIPLYLYLYYNVYDNINIMIQRAKEILFIKETAYSINNITMIPYENINHHIILSDDDIIQTMSYEVVKYLIKNKIYINSKIINDFYENPFNYPKKSTTYCISKIYITKLLLAEKPCIYELKFINKINNIEIITSYDIELLINSKKNHVKIMNKLNKQSNINMTFVFDNEKKIIKI